MPITPVTELLFDRAYVLQEYPVLEARIVATEGSQQITGKPPLTIPACSANPGTYIFISTIY